MKNLLLSLVFVFLLGGCSGPFEPWVGGNKAPNPNPYDPSDIGVLTCEWWWANKPYLNRENFPDYDFYDRYCGEEPDEAESVP